MINVELKRLAHLLNDMQRQDLDAPEVATAFDVVLSLCGLVSLVRYQVAKTIHLEVDAPHAFNVLLPEKTLRQAVLNLVLNAVEALSNRISGHICIHISKSSLGLAIQVFDNGAGFSPAILETGIADLPALQTSGEQTGLAMTHGFIKNMGGSIKLSNRFPHGACVTVLLPKSCLLKKPHD